jgi:hypothetical protein
MITFWLVLTAWAPVATSTTLQQLHVGNFPSMATCEAAAKDAQIIPNLGSGLPHMFVCVQANDTGSAPPN